MDKKEAQSRLMDYLYDEMSTEERQQFEDQLHNDPELQQELNEMQSVHKLLQKDDEQITPGNLILIQPGEKASAGTGATPRSDWTKTLRTFTAIAAAILLAFALFSFGNLQIAQTEHGMIISFGSTPEPIQQPSDEYVTGEEFVAMLNELQEQNNQVMASALEETRMEHQQQMEDVIRTLTSYYDQRRQQDLVLVSEGLAQLEQESYYRYLQTEEALEDLIFALNFQQTAE